MKKSRFLAAATTAAVAVSTVAPAYAAQIGPLEQNQCKVTLTAAEKSYLDAMSRELYSKLDPALARDINLGLEAAYPGARAVGNDFVDAYQHQLTGHKTRKSFNQALNSVESDSYINRLSASGMNQETAAFYLILRADAAYGHGLVDGSQYEPEDWENYFVEASSIDDEFEGNMIGLMLILLFGVTDVLGDETQLQRFYTTFDKTPSGKYFASLNPFFNAHMKAADACLRGGNATVAYPTGTTASKPSNPSKPADQNTGVDAGQAQDEQGSSTAGIIIGIIAAVLAVVGIAAAVAPQLGFQVPGLG